MLLIKKYIFPLLLFCFFAGKLYAQQTSLPSLIESKHNTDAQLDEITEAFFKKKMYVQVTTSKNKIFVGEPVMATYKFYVAMHIGDQPTVEKQPEFSGCSVKELNFDQGPDFETINNEPYAIYTIRRVQLTPLQDGKLSLGQAVVNNFIQVDNSSSIVPKKYNIEISNPETTIDVDALPEANKPADFSGITGVFTITASVKNKSVPVGENGHLIITIKGAGNLDAITQPQINWPKNIDHFDGTDSQHIDQNTFPISGELMYDFPFVGKKEGSIIIPPVSFSFFNTDTKQYQTVSTDSIAINFTKALAKKDEFTDIVTEDPSNRKYLWIIPAIAIVVLTISIISFRKNKKQQQKNKHVVDVTTPPEFVQPQPTYTLKFRTDFSRYLEELKQTEGNKPFFEKAKKILIVAVAERTDSQHNSEQILITELKQRTYNAPVCNKVAGLFEAINVHLYAPYETNADLEFYYTDLKTVVEELQAET